MDDLLRIITATMTNPDAARRACLKGIHDDYLAGKHLRPPGPMKCPGCRGFTMVQVVSAGPNSCRLLCPAGHSFDADYPPNRIALYGNYTRLDRPLQKGRLRGRLPQMFKQMANGAYRGVPKGYPLPSDLITSAGLACSTAQHPGMIESHRVVLILQAWQGCPQLRFIEPGLAKVAQDSPFPIMDSGPIGHFAPGAFIFPPGHEFPFLAFAEIEPGWHEYGHDRCFYYTPYRRLLFWVPLLFQTGETYTAEVTLGPDCPSIVAEEGDDPVKRFLVKCFRLWLILNLVEGRERAYLRSNRKDFQRARVRSALSVSKLGFSIDAHLGTAGSRRMDNSCSREIAPHWVGGHAQIYRCRVGGKIVRQKRAKLPYRRMGRLYLGPEGFRTSEVEK